MVWTNTITQEQDVFVVLYCGPVAVVSHFYRTPIRQQRAEKIGLGFIDSGYIS